MEVAESDDKLSNSTFRLWSETLAVKSPRSGQDPLV